MLRRSSTRHAPIQAHATPPTALRATLGLQLMIWAPPPHWLRSAGITQEPTRSQHLRRSLATPQSASMPAPTRKSASHLLEKRPCPPLYPPLHALSYPATNSTAPTPAPTTTPTAAHASASDPCTSNCGTAASVCYRCADASPHGDGSSCTNGCSH